MLRRTTRTGTALAAALTAALLVPWLASSALAGAASSAAASAYGLQLSGNVTIPKLPDTSSAAADGTTDEDGACVVVAAAPAPPSGCSAQVTPDGSLVVSATLRTVTQASADPTTDHPATLQGLMQTHAAGALPSTWTARAYSRTEGLDVLIPTTSGDARLTADVLEAESATQIVDGAPVNATAARATNVRLTLLGLTPTELLPSVIEDRPNNVIFDSLGVRIVLWETSPGGSTSDGTTSVTALRVSVAGTLVTAPAELHVSGAQSSADPAPEPEPTPSPTPEPEPTPDPEPSPTPDPDPSPTPDPDPSPTPDPDPSPTPDPDPTPSPTSSPGDDGGEVCIDGWCDSVPGSPSDGDDPTDPPGDGGDTPGDDRTPGDGDGTDDPEDGESGGITRPGDDVDGIDESAEPSPSGGNDPGRLEDPHQTPTTSLTEFDNPFDPRAPLPVTGLGADLLLTLATYLIGLGCGVLILARGRSWLATETTRFLRDWFIA